MKKRITAVLLAASLGFGLGMTTASAASNPQKDACKNGGWRTATDADGNTFKNQGRCISYVNGGGTLILPDGGEGTGTAT